MALRQRLQELRGGHPDANIEPALGRILEEIVQASNPCEFVAGAYLELGGRLVEAYRWHQRSADPAANAPEIQLCGRIIPNLEAHLGWAGEFLAKRAVLNGFPGRNMLLTCWIEWAEPAAARHTTRRRTLPFLTLPDLSDPHRCGR